MTNYHDKYVKLMDDYIDQSYTYGSCLKEIQDLKGALSIEQFISGSLRFELADSKAREKELRQRTIAHLEETENLLILEGTVKRLIEEMIVG